MLSTAVYAQTWEDFLSFLGSLRDSISNRITGFATTNETNVTQSTQTAQTKPDLTVTDLILSSTNLTAPTTIRFDVVVKNIGEASVSSYTLTWSVQYDGGTATGSSGRLTKLDTGQTETLIGHVGTYSYKSAGTYSALVRVDTSDDSNTANNELTKTITIYSSAPTCPTCLSPSAWSTCTSNSQSRTNYKCDSTTNYQCQSYTEIQSCTPTSATSGLPDLIVEDIAHTYGPNYQTGAKYEHTIQSKVKNIGTVAVNTITADINVYYPNNSLVAGSGISGFSITINPGESKIVVSTGWSRDYDISGTYIDKARIDPYNAIQESNENNNELTKTFTFQPITSISCDPYLDCSPPSAWTACASNKTQSRLNYKCDATTGYKCQSYYEIQSCTSTTPSTNQTLPITTPSNVTAPVTPPPIICPTSPSSSTCPSGQYPQPNYDNRGCLSSYSCVGIPSGCPYVPPVSCPNGTYTKPSYDAQGCVKIYECSVITSNVTIPPQAVISTPAPTIQTPSAEPTKPLPTVDRLRLAQSILTIESLKIKFTSLKDKSQSLLTYYTIQNSTNNIQKWTDVVNLFNQSINALDNIKSYISSVRDTATEGDLDEIINRINNVLLIIDKVIDVMLSG